MGREEIQNIWHRDTLDHLFPRDRADKFFDALYADNTEGAYDIGLDFKAYSQDSLQFEFQLKRRPDKCLSCSRTFGLPKVFARHPIINIKGLIADMDRHLNGQARCTDWRLGTTRQISNDLHVIPLTVFLSND